MTIYNKQPIILIDYNFMLYKIYNIFQFSIDILIKMCKHKNVTYQWCLITREVHTMYEETKDVSTNNENVEVEEPKLKKIKPEVETVPVTSLQWNRTSPF